MLTALLAVTTYIAPKSTAYNHDMLTPSCHVLQARPFAVGLNCALGAADMQPYIANLAKCADCYVFAYPNAGLPNAMGGYDQKGDEMAAGQLTNSPDEACDAARLSMRGPVAEPCI